MNPVTGFRDVALTRGHVIFAHVSRGNAEVVAKAVMTLLAVGWTALWLRARLIDGYAEWPVLIEARLHSLFT